MMLHHEGERESEDNDNNDEHVLEYFADDVVEHDAKFSVRHPVKFEQPAFIIM